MQFDQKLGKHKVKNWGQFSWLGITNFKLFEQPVFVLGIEFWQSIGGNESQNSSRNDSAKNERRYRQLKRLPHSM